MSLSMRPMQHRPLRRIKSVATSHADTHASVRFKRCISGITGGQFHKHQNLNNVDLDHFQLLFRGVAMSVDDIDALLEPALDRPVDELDPIERSVLRMAVCELRDCLETPARVVINEAVELTKRFGADQGHKYVNGVIDKVAISLRATEMKAGK